MRVTYILEDINGQAKLHALLSLILKSGSQMTSQMESFFQLTDIQTIKRTCSN